MCSLNLLAAGEPLPDGIYALKPKTHCRDAPEATDPIRHLTLAEIPQALKSKQVDALLVVMPLTEKYLTMLRNFIPKAGKLNPTVVPIESAGAIAAVTRYYQSYELPKGTIRGSPPIPDDDMSTAPHCRNHDFR